MSAHAAANDDHAPSSRTHGSGAPLGTSVSGIVDDRIQSAHERLHLVRDRAEAVTAALGSRTEHLVGEVADDVGQRVEELGRATRARVHDLEDELGVDAAQVGQTIRFAAWHVVRAVLVVATAVPRLVVAMLGRLGDLVDDLATRGADVGERTRELADAVPPARASRQRERRRTLLAVGAGAVVGFVAGLLVGRRQAPIVTYEPVPSAAATDPSAATGDLPPATGDLPPATGDLPSATGDLPSADR